MPATSSPKSELFLKDFVRKEPLIRRCSWLETAKRYLVSLLLIAAWTALIKGFIPRIELLNLAMTYLLANVLIAVRYGQGPAVLSAVVSVACFD